MGRIMRVSVGNDGDFWITAGILAQGIVIKVKP